VVNLFYDLFIRGALKQIIDFHGVICYKILNHPQLDSSPSYCNAVIEDLAK
jgi:hypothetical protein